MGRCIIIREEAQVQSSHPSISFSRPLGQDETLWASPSDDGAKEGKDEQWKRRRQRVDDDSLHATDGGNLRISEQNTRSKGCGLAGRILVSMIRPWGKGKGGVGVAAAHFPRKHYLDRVIAVRLSLVSPARPHALAQKGEG
jgi:hypothetical protein